MPASWRRNPRVSATELDRGLVLLDAHTRRVFELNPTGAIVWDSIEEGLEKVVSLVADAFSVDEATAKRDISVLLDELAEAGLIVPQH